MVVVMSAQVALLRISIRQGSEKTDAETNHLPADCIACMRRRG